ncbi:MAG TPA: ABC transporter ATP-binding protein [Candidatus Dormibacteraeota bacterium]|nr:ABC transporter ATP-binding protein [Candidatus Dormibacteraeota bacterium]
MSLLQVQRLSAFYGSFQALFDVSLEAAPGETIAVIGANGAGKTTCLRAIAGVLPVPVEAVRFAGDAVGGRPAHDLVARGVVMVPEGRRIFPSLTVEENLLVGAYRGRPGPWTLARVYDLFPVLAERRRQPGPNLSGGEQQMLAIGRGLMGNPRLLLVDEISLGLAPIVVRGLYRVLRTIAAEGTTILVVDQDVSQIMDLAQRVYCFRKGAVSLEGRPADLTRARLAAAYFGV